MFQLLASAEVEVHCLDIEEDLRMSSTKYSLINVNLEDEHFIYYCAEKV